MNSRFRNLMAGAKRSWVVWLNMLTAALASLELATGNLTVIFGPKKTAAIMVIVGIANVILRATKTNESLENKGANALEAKAIRQASDPQP